MWKNISLALAVPFIIGITGLAFESPKIYHAVAPWTAGILTAGLFIGLFIKRYSISFRHRGFIDLKAEMELDELRNSLLLAWVLLTAFMVCLWFVPHILPAQAIQTPITPATK